MQRKMKLTLLFLGMVMLVNAANALSPREELQQMVVQLQKDPGDAVLRQKLIKLASGIKPVPLVPEAAREPFVMGATVLKKASDPAGASKAVDLFTQALTVAPWFADAYYNRAVAREAAGQFNEAIDDLKFYLEFKLTDAERREAQDKIYSLKANALLASTQKAEQDKIASAEQVKRQAEQAKRDVITQIKNAVGNRNYRMDILTHDQNSPFAGANENELHGRGNLYRFGDDDYSYFWKFFDDHVELWFANNCFTRGDSWGPNINDMRWFGGCTPDSDKQIWGEFDLQSGQFYTTTPGSRIVRPVRNSEFDPDYRYSYTRYSPPK